MTGPRPTGADRAPLPPSRRPLDPDPLREPPPRPSGVRAPGRGVVIQTAFYGDLILTTPLIRRAAERHGAPVDVVLLPAAAPLLANTPCVRERILSD